jgi:hypothetical protein
MAFRIGREAARRHEAARPRPSLMGSMAEW